MDQKYYVDKNVLSVLLKTTNDTIVMDNFEKMLNGLTLVINSTINEFLKGKGVQMDYDSIRELDDSQLDPKIKDLLKSKELMQLVDANTQQYFKVIVNGNIGGLSPETQKDVMDYMNGLVAMNQEQNQLILENVDAINEVSQILKTSILNEAKSNAVNLGGNLSNQSSTLEAVATPVVQNN